MLHNNPNIPLKEATNKQIAASIRYYRRQITVSVHPCVVVRCKEGLAKCLAERANRIGKNWK